MRRSVHVGDPSGDPVQPSCHEVFPGELPVAPVHPLLFATPPPVQPLYDVALHLMQMLRTVEPIEVIGPAPQHRIEESDLLLQRTPIVSPHRLADLLPYVRHGTRTGKAITELPATIPAGGFA